jgi:hypothetical protein
MSQFAMPGFPSIVADETFNYVYDVLFFIILANLRWRPAGLQSGLPWFASANSMSRGERRRPQDEQVHSV